MSVDTTTTAAFDAAAAAQTAADAELLGTDIDSTTDTGLDAEVDAATDNDIDADVDADLAGDAEVEVEEDVDVDAHVDAQDVEETEEVASVLDTGTEVTFASLELPAPLLGVLNEAGVTTAFPIQAATIPDALIGRDVLGRGRTGSGKTLAFGLPTLARLEGLRAKPRRPLALVLVPTRELAMQVEEALRPYARALRLRIRSVYGGAPMRKQIDGLRYGVELLVATPGRLSDLIERGECELGDVDMAILDEADQMCDMGFLPHVCELMDQVAEGGQRLLFSATLDGAVEEIVKKYMNDPMLHEVDPQAGSVTTMSHHLLMVAPQHKAKVAAQIAGRHAAEGDKAEARSIFFVRTQMAVDRVMEQLRERGLPAAGLHGGMTQVARTKTLEDFKDGRTPILIATDVAARGIHVDGIDLVVHLDPPRDSKDYLHRAGRTARAGQAGVVASLILPKQRRQAQRMMNDAGVTAEELDAAPLGVGGRWESASTALADLTGAREVPEPGDVSPFTMPVRERERTPRFGDRPGGDRFGRDRDARRGGGSFERRGYEGRGGYEGHGARDGRTGSGYENRGSGAGTSTGTGTGTGTGEGRSFERRDGRTFDRARGTEARGAETRGNEARGTEGRSFEDRGAGARSSESRGFEKRGFENRGTENRGFDNRGSGPRTGDARGGYQGRNFDRTREGGERFNRDDRRPGSYERRDGEQRYGNSSGNRDGWRGAPSGRGYEGRGTDNRGTDNRSTDSRGTEGRGTDSRGTEGRGYEGRSSENRSFPNRGTGAPRSFENRGFNKDRGTGSEGRGGFDRNRGTDRPGHSDRRGGGAAGARPRTDWDRGTQQRQTSRDGDAR
jgi:superfamily II DNA/RNA helicase